ncbi:MAG: hypothetical protein S4CHLAM20_03580 [Chlamydiia bacterium]|nr:hypothetical protein [Chlamydiia bacterium]
MLSSVSIRPVRRLLPSILPTATRAFSNKAKDSDKATKCTRSFFENQEGSSTQKQLSGYWGGEGPKVPPENQEQADQEFLNDLRALGIKLNKGSKTN